MSPINWLILFLFFMINFLMVMTMINFYFTKFNKINLINKPFYKNYNKFI
uniref:ATP synthase F0 subunit 8 n=1 Tax=Nurudea yanoniella TaxID=509176 RepID=A0A1Z1MWE6_9HEMI|nr:ATP synthase F0 subunit 8 [Nurudea yanoniella]ARW70282.1 ATP synthase F0 subunit 8 [Nurudea yanoniella]QBK84299.1 ATP synthase F0 subunit 8 [Nurudea yanoniella]